ncbi:hypothetical protein Tco_0701697 [Tanacetum coccineum]
MNEGDSVCIDETAFGAEVSLVGEDIGFMNLIASVLSSNVMWQVSSVCCLLVLKTLKALETNENWTSKDMKEIHA